MVKRHRKHKRFSRHRHHKKRGRKRNLFNINSQILNGFSFIILGVLLLRFSTFIFIDLISWQEGIFWGYLIGVILIIGGIFSLVAWWRNNVSMFTTRHRVKWN